MNYSPRSTVWFCVSTLLLLAACSTDKSGLGPFDAAGAGTGGRGMASGTGGSMGEGTGGGGASGLGGMSAAGSGGGSAADGGTSSGGSGGGGVGMGTGGADGTGSGGALAGSGGRSGTGGRANGGPGTGGTNGGSSDQPECQVASDCRLQNDCCTCAAVPNGAPTPECRLACVQSKCSQQNLPSGAVACVAGRCVAGFNCDSSKVVCDLATPSCPSGTVPTVNQSGNCYAGACVPVTQCARVSSCAVCGGPEGTICVVMQTQTGNRFHCVTVPSDCRDRITCDCLGPSTCLAPYTTCSNLSGPKGIACSCPNC